METKIKTILAVQKIPEVRVASIDGRLYCLSCSGSSVVFTREKLFTHTFFVICAVELVGNGIIPELEMLLA